MKTNALSRLILTIFASAALFFVGCEQNDSLGDNLEDAGDAAGDAIDDAGDETGDALDDAGDAVDDATN